MSGWLQKHATHNQLTHGNRDGAPVRITRTVAAWLAGTQAWQEPTADNPAGADWDLDEDREVLRKGAPVPKFLLPADASLDEFMEAIEKVVALTR